MSSPYQTADHQEPSLLLNREPLSFEGRLPDPSELLRWGGRPGFRYAIIQAMNLGDYREMGWSPVRDLSSFPISGPSGRCEAMVVSQGSSIEGASPNNGIREWSVDHHVLWATGLDPTVEEPEHETVLAPCGSSVKPRGLGAHITRCSDPACTEARASKE